MDENVPRAIESIKTNKFGVSVVPTHLQKNIKVWEEGLLANTDYATFLQKFPMLHSAGYFNPEKPFAKKVETYLVNKKALKAAGLHPFAIYHVLKMYEKNRRHLEHNKDRFHKAKMEKAKITPNPQIVAKLTQAFEKSFTFYPPTGLKLLITLDNRHSLYTKGIFSKHKHFVSVFETALMIALTYLKRENNVTVLTFTNSKELEPLGIDKTMSYEAALKHCTDNKKKKTKHSLDTPIAYAEKNKLPIDVFITITDGICNVSPKGTTPTRALAAYQKALNIREPKYVVMGLARPINDMKEENPQVLAIAGFTSATVKVMEAFMKGAFN